MPESTGGIDGATVEATSTAGAQATATAEAHAEAGVNVEIKNNGNSPVGKSGASRAGGGSNGNGGAPGQEEGVQVTVDAKATATAEAKIDSQMTEDGKIIVGKDDLKKGKLTEAKLMTAVLEGKPLSRDESAKLAGIMKELGVQGDIDKASKGHTGAIGRLEIDFAKERNGQEGEVSQIVSDETRKNIVELYVQGSLDDFELTDDVKNGLSKLKGEDLIKKQIEIVSRGRRKRKEIEALARKNQELQEKKRYLEYIRRRSNEQSQARSQQRADAARKNLNDYSH